MRAAVHSTYGSPDVLRLEDLPKPLVDDDGVLVRVHAASVNALDLHLMRGEPYVVRLSDGLRAPKRIIAGVDVAGHVEAVGRNVTRFRPGDEVFGQRGGSFAEYVCAPEHKLVSKPTGLTFEQAAAIPIAGSTALQALRDKGHLQQGQRVLVIGAAGGVGTFAVQIATWSGAHVTAVCRRDHVAGVRALGADEVIDYTADDFAAGDARYDVIIDVAARRSLRACMRRLSGRGTLVLVGASPGRWVGPLARIGGAVVLSRCSRRRMVPFLAAHSSEDLVTLARLALSGEVAPVIDRVFDLTAAAEAMRHLEVLHPMGKVVITV